MGFLQFGVSDKGKVVGNSIQSTYLVLLCFPLKFYHIFLPIIDQFTAMLFVIFLAVVKVMNAISCYSFSWFLTTWLAPVMITLFIHVLCHVTSHCSHLGWGNLCHPLTLGHMTYISQWAVVDRTQAEVGMGFYFGACSLAFTMFRGHHG